VTPWLFGVLEDSLRYSDETNGAFDITIGPLMKSWGFFRGWGRLPSPPELAEVLKRIGYWHIKLDPATQTVGFDEPGIELDLGAIGKGYAVDRAVDILRAEGIARALVSSGTSSIYALGSPPGEQGWEIAVCHPLDRRKVARSLRLQNLAISVSGEYEKSFELGGRIYAHILDPRSGIPVEDMLMTVAISRSSAETDAMSTSFFVAGVERSRIWLERHPDLTAILFIPIRSEHTVEQIVLNSSVTRLAADRFVRL
jgi:thiamine biosynthesis lipoprotein